MNFICPLTEEDQHRIHMGGIIRKHFHADMFPNGLMVLIGMNADWHKATDLLEQGWDCTSIPLTAMEIKLLEESKKAVRAGYKGFNIFVYPEQLDGEKK